MKVAGKGSKFKVTIATVLTAVSQCISIEMPDRAMETVETDILDNTAAGIPHDPTGRTEGGSAKTEIYLDPTAHAFMNTWLDATVFADMKKVCAILIGSTPAATWTFTAAGLKLGGKIAFNDYVKANAEYKVDGAVTVS